MKQECYKYTCDDCGRELLTEHIVNFVNDDIESTSLLQNWYKVNKHGKQKKHFCSRACISNWAIKGANQ